MIVGVVISAIVLALGAFLYMRSEGEDVSSLSSVSSTASLSNPQVVEASVQGEPMVVSDAQGSKPFIMAIIPGDLQLEDGAYRAKTGSKINVRVRSLNVENGVLYFKTKDSKDQSVQESEKLGDLVPSDLPGEYELPFEFKKDTAGLLIAVMKGKDGQEVQLSVNVATR